MKREREVHSTLYSLPKNNKQPRQAFCISLPGFVYCLMSFERLRDITPKMNAVTQTASQNRRIKGSSISPSPGCLGIVSFHIKRGTTMGLVGADLLRCLQPHPAADAAAERTIRVIAAVFLRLFKLIHTFHS